jgi:hypothetical protein
MNVVTLLCPKGKQLDAVIDSLPKKVNERTAI